jgi:tetratricopeptide (TPR) repeat protein
MEKGGRNAGVIGLQNVLLTAAGLPGLDAGDDHAPVPLPELERTVAGGWHLYWQGRFADLAGLLEYLIPAAEATGRDKGAAASRPLAQSYQLAADVLVHAGNDDLAFQAARRALRVAIQGDDPLQYATLAGTLSWAALHQGRLKEAERIARAAAEMIQPSGKVPVEHLTVYGALLLSAAAPAAAAADKDAADAYLSEAKVAALRFTGGDRHDYQVSFGPTQVAMQEAHALSVLREAAGALRAAERVRRADLLRISWGSHQLDVAQARLDKGDTGGAAGALLEAFGTSPEWARHQGLWRDASARTVRQGRLGSQKVQKLARVAGLR